MTDSFRRRYGLKALSKENRSLIGRVREVGSINA
jgi:hypothetical protein